MKNMMNIYKPFILICLTCLAAITTSAQVIGDKYIGEIETASYPKILESESHRDADKNLVTDAFDGKNDTYWQINNLRDANNSGWVVLDLGDEAAANISSINFEIRSAANRQPTQVFVYTSTAELSGTATEWGSVVLSQTNIQSALKDKAFSLNIEDGITINRYIKIEFKGTTDDEQSTSNSRVSEISFSFANGGGFTSEIINLTDIPIKHKEAKWYSLVGNNNILGTFDVDGDEEPKMIDATENGSTMQIQNTHVLEETIYVTKGSTTRLTLPDWLNGTSNNRAYQRWYDYTTGKTFATGKTGDGDVQDLLTPPEIRRNTDHAGNVPNNGTGYRFANGYIGSPLSDNPLYAMDFYFPTDATENEYVVACDVSGYTDYTAKFEQNTPSQFLNLSEDGGETAVYEPTLAHRFIYHIIAGEQKTAEEMSITMSATRIPNKTQEMVALQRDARTYIINGNAVTVDNPLKVTLEDNTAGIELCNDEGGNTFYLEDEDGGYWFDGDNYLPIPTEEPETGASDEEKEAWNNFKKDGNDYPHYRLYTMGDGINDYLPLIGESRVIHFKYRKDENKNTDKTVSVNSVEGGDPKATIVVSNGSDVVARFYLTFVEESRLLSQSQVKELDDITKGTTTTNDADPDWKKYLSYRTPYALTETYGRPLVELNFDYGTTVMDNLDYSASGYFTFPLAWSSSSYGFFDGGPDYTGSNNDIPEWGYYAITNKYLEAGSWGTVYAAPNDASEERQNSNSAESDYHLFADVSDRPGIIARLPFTENLCSGTELFVTAWVKSGRGSKNSNNAAALFTIMGVNEEEKGGKTYTPIYRYQTGQIPTTYLNDQNVTLPGFNQIAEPTEPKREDYESDDAYNEAVEKYNADLSEYRSQPNEWMQAYFSFVNPTDQNFDSYVLQIDNNSASTEGGDIYIDDIRVYVMPANPEVTQLSTSCSNPEDGEIDGKTKYNVNFDFERLLSRVGVDEVPETDNTTAEQTKRVAFCLIDKDEYDAEILAALGGTIEEGEQATEEQKLAALNAAKASIYVADDDTETGKDYITLSFSNKFSSNDAYKEGNDGLQAEETYHFYSRIVDGSNSLTTDFFAGVKPNHHYYILVANPDAVDAGENLEMFVNFNEDKCAIKGEFLVTPRNMIRVNGEIVDPTLTRCENETYNFTAELRVPDDYDEEGKVVYVPFEGDVYFDWFFGTEDEYIEVNGNYGMTLETALKTFRDEYPDATEITDDMITEAGESTDLGKALTMVKYYAEEAEGAAQGQHPHPLVLHAQTVNITMLKGGLNLIAQPIRIDVGDVAVCWDYIPLTLAVSNAAPTVKPGFNWIKYPDGTGENEDNYENLDPCLRIGLDQIKSVSTENGHTLSIDLHNATFATDGGQSIAQVTDADKKIYLVSTDDPAYGKFFADGAAFDQMSLPSGEITYFKATKYESGNTSSDQNLMKLNFDLTTETETDLVDDNGQKMKFKFEPKEGYTYNFAVHFNEIDSKGEATTACAGHFVLPVKVVPKYVKWEGSADCEGNWNNDTNWKRVSSGELKMTSYVNDEYMTDGANDNAGGFVPMLFTKVIMPKDSKIKLYRAGYSNNSWVLGDPSNESDDPSLPTQKPTLNIQYDLMAYGNETAAAGDVTTKLYRVNLCDEIHFEEGAEMLRPEYLLYNKAWIDMKVPAGEWTLVSVPLQDVVSGDWYTKASGTEDSEYFTDITFTSDYNRLKPFVTQRTWSDWAQIVENESGNVPASFTATWSALFNDTSVPYASGNGYSVKTAGIKSSTDDATENYGTLTFRFPKADTSYDYSSASGTIARTNPGRFITDEILKREPGEAAEANKAQEKEMKVALTNIATRTGESGTTTWYAIVGNPFMANLDVSKFIEENSSVLEAKYWIDSNVEGEISGSATTDGSSWTWNETDAAGLVGQYEAFCVQLKADATSKPEVEFTPDMAVLSNTTGTTTTNNLVIKAESASGITSAALAYDVQANDGYVSAEDAELITDILGNGDKPSVYTVADNMALSVNKINDIRLIPVGLFAGDDDVTKVTFTGVAALLEPTLYDAEMNTETPLTEGYTLTVEGASHGRYFIRTRGAGEGTTDIEETVAGGDNSVSVYSVEQGKVVVASGAGLKDVMIYSVGGALLKNESVGAGLTACTIDNVDSGVVIVKVVTPEGTTTRKIMVK